MSLVTRGFGKGISLITLGFGYDNQVIAPIAITSEETFGQLSVLIYVTSIITPVGITSEEAFGDPRVYETYVQTITPVSIDSEEGFGYPKVRSGQVYIRREDQGGGAATDYISRRKKQPERVTIQLIGIDTDEDFGTPKIYNKFHTRSIFNRGSNVGKPTITFGYNDEEEVMNLLAMVL